MMRETENDVIELIAVNDFLNQQNAIVKVTDVYSEEVIFEKNITAKENSVTFLEKIKVADKSMCFYLIEWECDGVKYKNHYLYGQSPYDFESYLTLLKKSGLFELYGFSDKGQVNN